MKKGPRLHGVLSPQPEDRRKSSKQRDRMHRGKQTDFTSKTFCLLHMKLKSMSYALQHVPSFLQLEYPAQVALSHALSWSPAPRIFERLWALCFFIGRITIRESYIQNVLCTKVAPYSFEEILDSGFDVSN